jgi:stage IV sporulation protein FB
LVLGNASPTPYDLYFQISGIPVRVHPLFWMGALVIGFYPGVHPMNLIMWVLVVLVSILVHEFGHALLMRRFGQSPHVVLYLMGGYAADGASDPYSTSSWRVSSVRSSNTSALRRQQQRILILMGGPGAGFLLAALVMLIVVATGGVVRFELDFPIFWRFNLGIGDFEAHAPLYELVHMLLLVNILWGLLNLLPVFPLDGGQICRELLVMYNPWNGLLWSCYISFGVALTLAILGLRGERIFLTVLFGLLAYQSFLTIQQTTGRGGGFGGRPW